MQPYRPFSEFRPKDYRVPRSLREAYGYEPVLYEQEPDSSFSWWAGLCAWIIAVGLLVWYIAGWL